MDRFPLNFRRPYDSLRALAWWHGSPSRALAWWHGSLSRAPARSFYAVVLLTILVLTATLSDALGAQPGETSATGSRSPQAAADTTIRIRLRESASEVRLDSRGPLHVGPLGRSERRSLLMHPPILIRLVADRFSIRDGRGRTRTLSARNAVFLDRAEPGLTLDGVAYPGSMALHLDDHATGFDVIEHVPIEEYLPGVLTRELYPNWSPTTYAAQAVAARSYALNERQRRLALGATFDLESGTKDQAYAGSDASEKAREAVVRTRGMTLTYQGAVLRAYYSSTCGDRPASARDIWPIGTGFEFNLAGPIQAVPRECPCEFSPRHRWTVERSAGDVLTRFRAFGVDRGMAIRAIASLKSIEPERLNPAGRPAAYRVIDDAGLSWRLSAEDLRLALNYDGSSGIGAPAPPDAVWSGDVQVEITGDHLVINGRGYGHGVGMCQFGAEGLARQGWSEEKILMHYYPGAEITRAR